MAENMVLRTVYLPREIDAQLKVIAFQQDRNKNDIVCELVVEALEARKRITDPSRDQ